MVSSMPSLPLRTRIGYGMGSITTGTYGTVPGLLLMPYLTDQLGVAAAVAGLIVFAPKAWDFVLNPIAGRISDHAGESARRRRPFLIWAGLALVLLFAAVFFGPHNAPVPAAIWVLLLSLACASAYAFFQVPFLAMAAEITDDYAERTRVMAWRVALLSFAILLAGGASPLLVGLGDGVTGFRIMAVVMAGLLLLGVVGAWLGTRSAPNRRDESASGTLREQLRIVWRNHDARALGGAFALQAVAIGMLLSAVLYVARYLVPVPGAATLAFVCFVAPVMLCTPVWRRVGLSRGKKQAYVLAIAVLALGLTCLSTSGTGELGLVLAAAGLTGVGYAGAQLFPLAMLPDVAAEDAKRTGENRIGMISGLWSGIELLGLAVGAAVLGILLDLGGYIEATGTPIAQPDSVLWAIVLGVSIVPSVLCLLSLIPLTRYRLDEAMRAKEAKPAHSTGDSAEDAHRE